MDDKKEVDDLQKIFAAGDAWLRHIGVVNTPIAHNAIVMNLYMHFPKCRYVEYFMATQKKTLHVVMHYPFWSLIFRNKGKVVDNVIALLRDYLPDYTITVELRRYKKGVEKSNEIPAEIAGTTAP